MMGDGSVLTQHGFTRGLNWAVKLWLSSLVRPWQASRKEVVFDRHMFLQPTRWYYLSLAGGSPQATTTCF